MEKITNLRDLNIELCKNNKIHYENIEIPKLRSIHELLGNEECKIVKCFDVYYLTFSSLRNIQFVIKNINNQLELSFLKVPAANFINLDKSNLNYIQFISLELFQGNSAYKKLYRFLSTILLPLFIVLISFFSDLPAIQNTINSILSAVSIFVAIFTLFVMNNEYVERKISYLFSKGKINYYFSIDRNLVKTAFLAIFTLILSNLLLPNNIDSSSILLKIALNSKVIAFISMYFIGCLATIIVFRSVIEFYLTRPEKFITGQLKDEYLKKW